MGIGRRGLIFGAASAAAGAGLWWAEQDRTISSLFQETAKDYPIVNSLRRSIGLTETIANGRMLRGSAVLLDKMGTLALTNHQFNDSQMLVNFLPEPSPLFNYSTARATMIAKNQKTDTSYWRLDDPSVIGQFGLEPIQWGALNRGVHGKGEILLSVGFPAYAEGRIDARPHQLLGYVPMISATGQRMTKSGALELYDEVNQCKIEMTQPMGPGNSGGGIFNADGKFVGVATYTEIVNSGFTPSDAIWDGYVNLVPAARRYPHKPVYHKECHIP